MIEFMNAISPTFVAFAVVIIGAPVVAMITHKSFKAAGQERRLRYALEELKTKDSHIEKMATVKEIEGRGVPATIEGRQR